MEGPLVWLVYARAQGVGRARLGALMAACPDPTDAWRLDKADLIHLAEWDERSARNAVAARFSPSVCRAALEEWEHARQAGLSLVTICDPAYPERLRHIPNPPPYFYQLGPWRADGRPVVAIIGTRKPTSYGLAVARRIGRELAEAGLVVVSGMARGIDCAAHRGALDAGGQTVAVLGSGADVCYPKEARDIYEALAKTGAVISEQPPGTQPLRPNFPERNRVISGLAHGVLVVEAGEKSGTLITVQEALKQGRDVFAVPGPVTNPMSVGPHRLIRDGACLVTCARDILEELGLRVPNSDGAPLSLAGLDSDEERVLSWMGSEPRWAGDLAAACGLHAGAAQGLLTMLELKGLTRQLPGGQYIRIG